MDIVLSPEFGPLLDELTAAREHVRAIGAVQWHYRIK